MNFEPLEEDQARAILGWRYPPPYDFYNCDPQRHLSPLSYMLNPQNAFFAILSEHQALEGFCSFGEDGQVLGGNYRDPALDIGLGIRPDLTGKGKGKHYAGSVVDYGASRYRSTFLRVTVATFNQRAYRVWSYLNFEPGQIFANPKNGIEFVIMTRRSDRKKL